MSRRNTMFLAAVAAVAIVGAYWTLALAPKREAAAKLAKSITTEQGELTAAETEVATYERAKTGYNDNYSLVAHLGKAVPADDDVGSLMIQINAAAGASKIDFRTISVGAGAAPASAAKGGDVTKAPPPGATSVGSAGFAQMPFTFSFKGSFSKLGNFFERLDRFVAVKQHRLDVSGRLMVVNKISLAPDADGFPNIRASVEASTFIVPATQGLMAGATSTGPATAPATPVAPSTTASPPAPTAAIGANR